MVNCPETSDGIIFDRGDPIFCSDLLIKDYVWDSRKYKRLSEYRSATIWRYDSLEHIVDLLTHRALYVSRGDRFDDRYEGILLLSDNENPSEKVFVRPTNARHYYVNCWHINEGENIAWWERYGSGKKLAVQTTVGDLIDSVLEMPEQSVAVIAAQVYYAGSIADRTHIAQVVDPGVYEHYLVKDSDFSHEKEFRLICRIPENPERPDTPLCIRPPINLAGLHGRIVISPFCSPQERESLLTCLSQYDCGVKIEESSLAPPETADSSQSIRVWSDIRLMKHLRQ